MRRTLAYVIVALGAGTIGAGIGIAAGAIAHNRSVVGAYHRFAPRTTERVWSSLLIYLWMRKSRQRSSGRPDYVDWGDMGDKPPLASGQIPGTRLHRRRGVRRGNS